MHAAHGRDLRDFAVLLRRRKASVLLGLVVMLVLGSLYMVFAQKTYVSSAKVLVQQADSEVPAQGSRTTDSVNLDTEAQVVTSLPVAALAKDSLGSTLETPALANRVAVTVPPNTTVLQISFRASSPTGAQAGAEAFARSYLRYRSEAAQGRVAAQISHVTGQIRAVKTKLTGVRQRLSGATAGRAALQARQELLSTQFDSLSVQLAALKGLAVRPGTVLNEAQLPKTPISPNPMIVIPGALFAGLLLGLLLALWRDSRDPRIHGSADLDRILGITPVAELRVSVGKSGAPRLIGHEVRALYHSLRASGLSEKAAVLCVAPDAPGIGDAWCSALREAASASGTDAGQLAVPPVAEERAVSRRRRRKRRVAADEAPLTTGGAEDEDFQQELRRSRAEHDLVIVGAPGNHPVVDDLVLTGAVDAVVMVILLGRATRPSVAECLARIESGATTALFVVSLNPRRSEPSGLAPGSAPVQEARRRPPVTPADENPRARGVGPDTEAAVSLPGDRRWP